MTIDLTGMRFDERTWLPFLNDIERAWSLTPGARAMLRGARLRLMMTAVAP